MCPLHRIVEGVKTRVLWMFWRVYLGTYSVCDDVVAVLYVKGTRTAGVFGGWGVFSGFT